MTLIAFPLLLIPFALYNMVVFLLSLSFTDTLFSIPLLEGRRLPVTTADVLLAIAMLMIWLEAVKASRMRKGITDHVLSFLVLAAMVAELALVPQATTTTLLLLAVLGFVDFVLGLSVKRPSKQPEEEVAVEDVYHHGRY
jgi:hypothetical protein